MQHCKGNAYTQGRCLAQLCGSNCTGQHLGRGRPAPAQLFLPSTPQAAATLLVVQTSRQVMTAGSGLKDYPAEQTGKRDELAQQNQADQRWRRVLAAAGTSLPVFTALHDSPASPGLQQGLLVACGPRQPRRHRGLGRW